METICTTQTEIDLVHGLQHKQSSAFANLYTSYAPVLFGILAGIVKDQDRAEDLLHDAFIKIWITFHLYDPQQGRLFTWLVTITRRTALDEIRARRIRLEAKPTIRQRTPDQTDGVYVGGLLQQPLISLIAPKYGQILDLVYQGYKSVEIAELLTLPVGTVKTWRRLGLQQLKQVLSQDIHHYHRR
jgi:RNA polymerase sigma factor (sigma-70 family)